MMHLLFVSRSSNRILINLPLSNIALSLVIWEAVPDKR